MAAPATTARTTPTGKILDDGFSTKIAFSRVPGVNFWERSVKPPGLDGGGKINISTMFNTLRRTFAPKSLHEVTDTTVVALYDPGVLTQIYQLINQEGSITIRHPDGSTWDEWGFLDKFEPAENVEGTEPTANITICFTSYDPNNDVEAVGVVTSVTGT